MPPEAFRELPPLVELQAALPQDQPVMREAAEHFLAGLSFAIRPLSFEVVGRCEEVFVQMVARECDAYALMTGRSTSRMILSGPLLATVILSISAEREK